MTHTCCQCRDEYRWNQTFCQRCGTRNERSPILIAARLFAVGLVVMAVMLTAHLFARRSEFSGSGDKPVSVRDEAPLTLNTSRKTDPPQDPQFGNL